MYDYSWLHIWLILVKKTHAMENELEYSFTQFPKLVMKKQKMLFLYRHCIVLLESQKWNK